MDRLFPLGNLFADGAAAARLSSSEKEKNKEASEDYEVGLLPLMTIYASQAVGISIRPTNRNYVSNESAGIKMNDENLIRFAT